jgi:hypothetical protein
MAVNKTVDLLQVAKALDPRFAQDMPQEVADAFARGLIQRLIRTSKSMPGTTPDLRTPAQGGRAADQFGDYTGSIYAQHKDGRIARFKNPEVAEQGDDMRHAGWKARTAGVKGRSAFFDQAHVIREDSFTQVGSPERIAFDKAKALNPKLSGEQIAFALARQGHSIATPTTAPASDIMGKQIFETMKVGSTDADPRSTHKGDMVSDIFEATGERHYFAGTTSADQKSARGSAQVEPIESYFTRKGITTPAATAAPTAGADMLALGKSLHPDFEKNMPPSVRKAFEEGRIKTIFRTDSTTVPVGAATSRLRTTTTVDPEQLSIYAVDDAGRVARFGKNGAGWVGDPRMTGTTEKTTDATAFAAEVRYTDVKGSNEEYRTDRSRLSTEIGVGKRPVEFDDKGGVHEGSGITDFYHSSGEAEIGSAFAGTGITDKERKTVHKVKDFRTELSIKDGRPSLAVEGPTEVPKTAEPVKPIESEIDNATRLAEERIRIT